VIIVLLFTMVYWRIGTKANFGAELSKVDALYFALGTMTTAGTGTIAPISGLARGLVSGQMVVDFIFVASAVTIAITRLSEKSR
jgi:Ion channel